MFGNNKTGNNRKYKPNIGIPLYVALQASEKHLSVFKNDMGLSNKECRGQNPEFKIVSGEIGTIIRGNFAPNSSTRKKSRNEAAAQGVPHSCCP